MAHSNISDRPFVLADAGRMEYLPYQWVIEGDIEGCFAGHHHLMDRVRKSVGTGG